MTITLNEREIKMITETVIQYIDILREGEETFEHAEYMLETGLGSAIKKLCKGKNGEMIYSKYISHKGNYKYPSFEEWEMSRKDGE